MHISAAVIASNQHKSRDLLSYTTFLYATLKGGHLYVAQSDKTRHGLYRAWCIWWRAESSEGAVWFFRLASQGVNAPLHGL